MRKASRVAKKLARLLPPLVFVVAMLLWARSGRFAEEFSLAVKGRVVGCRSANGVIGSFYAKRYMGSDVDGSGLAHRVVPLTRLQPKAHGFPYPSGLEQRWGGFEMGVLAGEGEGAAWTVLVVPLKAVVLLAALPMVLVFFRWRRTRRKTAREPVEKVTNDILRRPSPWHKPRSRLGRRFVLLAKLWWIALLLLCVRSFFAADGIAWQGNGSFFISDRGRLLAMVPQQARVVATLNDHWLGFSFGRDIEREEVESIRTMPSRNFGIFSLMQPGSFFGQAWFVIVPFWSLALFGFVIHGGWLHVLRHAIGNLIYRLIYGRRDWRIANHLCLRCVYYLRASTDRCPECGTPVYVRPATGTKASTSSNIA